MAALHLADVGLGPGRVVGLAGSPRPTSAAACCATHGCGGQFRGRWSLRGSEP